MYWRKLFTRLKRACKRLMLIKQGKNRWLKVRNKKVLVFFNQIITESLASGGDVRCVETIKRWRDLNTEIVGPKTAGFLKKELKAKQFYSLPETFIDRWCQKKKSVFLIAPLYICRGINAIRLTKNLRPEVVYTTGDFICNTLPALVIKKKNLQIKWIANIFHLNLSPTKRRKNKFLFALGSFLLQRISFFLLKKADLIFLLNRQVKKSLIKLGFKPEKLIVLGAGIDIARVDKVKSRKPRSNKVVFLGRLNLTKGIFDLPKIWPLVLEKVPSARLILIGAGEEKMVRNLKDEFAKAGVLNTVCFKGFIKKSEDVYKIMKQGKVFILPSYEEGWGIVVFEAIACGLAPVTYNLPVFKEIFGEDIQTVSIGNTTIFAKTIVKFLSNEKLRKECVLNLNKKIKRYDWSKIAKKELKLIKEL